MESHGRAEKFGTLEQHFLAVPSGGTEKITGFAELKKANEFQ